ncbi:MAG TPA: DJ-1 family protein [Clostridiales bacterium]|nr:MAG: hypothetical protein A2X49_08455 [Lentisphaerae bacterium GWF2_52_8]HAN22006.1 DJ-1 family protein [Clostridiales bacterium]
MSKRIVFILADGFEEMEAIIPIDLLRRIDLDVVVAGLDTLHVTGAHKLMLSTDCAIEDLSTAGVAAVVLPGGMPGSMNLRNSKDVTDFVAEIYREGGIVAAICAAPIALAQAGVLKGKKATVYPGFEDKMPDAICTGARIERDGNLLTAKGAGVSFEFAAALAEMLGKGPEIKKTLAGMFCKE